MNTRLRTARRYSTLAIAAVATMATATGAGAGSIALSVDPTQLVLAGSSRGAFTVQNPTSSPLPLTASIVDYSIDPNGSFVVAPKVSPKRSARQWLSISPKSLTLAPHSNAVVRVRSHPAKRAAVGDHHALVLFSSTPSGNGTVRIRTRIGAPVLVRVEGKIKRRLVISRVSVARKTHQLRLVLLNRGNINERLLKHRVGVVLTKGKRTVQRFFPASRDILPFTQGLYLMSYRKSLQGNLTAIVTVRPVNGASAGESAPPLKPITKKFRVRF
jgi:hypothetical protein